jgi:uncharacterized protein
VRYEIIRDPLWNNIRVGPLALRLIDTPPFQRLRYVRQLGLAYLVYPGATHSRFEHALGTYHLSRLSLALLAEQGNGSQDGDSSIISAAALLHDIGHYPFSHALEEIGALHHEEVARPLITEGPVAEVLESGIGTGAPMRVFELITGRSSHPLQRLISGSLDLDKIEYLKRDALMCGVPYGEIDVDRLLHAIVLVDDPDTGKPVAGVREKGLSALESLLFAKYQMYRNVYWHHAVRSATAMYKRMVDDALISGALAAATLASHTDEGLLHQLDGAAPSKLLAALRERRLHKRALEIPAAELAGLEAEWIAEDRPLAVRAEDAIARELGLEAGDVLLDYPVKTQMLDLDVPVLLRSGQVRRIAQRGLEGAIDLPVLSDQLYRSARWLRVFVSRSVTIDRERLLRILRSPAEEIESRLRSGASLLSH